MFSVLFSLQACVRRRAIDSVTANPACPNEAAAERAVNEVWESCFNDTRPFDEASFMLPLPRNVPLTTWLFITTDILILIVVMEGVMQYIYGGIASRLCMPFYSKDMLVVKG